MAQFVWNISLPGMNQHGVQVQWRPSAPPPPWGVPVTASTQLTGITGITVTADGFFGSK